MSFSVYYSTVVVSIQAALQVALEALTDDSGDPLFAAVYFGRKVAPKEFPSVVYWADPSRPKATSVASSHYDIRFEFHCIAKETDPETGFAAANVLNGKLIKLFEDDRQFGHRTENVEIEYVDPEVERPRVRTRYETNLIVRFDKWSLPR